MGKRPSRSDDDDGDADDAKKREAECRGTLKALNAQFAAWVARRATESPIVSWGKGCEDYLKHVEKIKVRSLVRSLARSSARAFFKSSLGCFVCRAEPRRARPRRD